MRSLLVVVSLLLVRHGVCTAQETSGNIRGRLQSADSAPVAEARIRATSANLLGVRHSISARDGVFHLLALPPGAYTLRISAIGYRAVVVQDVRVQLGRTTGLGDLLLEAAALALEAITVTAPPVSLDPVRTTIGATLDADDLASLPGERDYRSVIAILPHVNASPHGDPVNAAGSTGLENMYFIDGLNVTSTRTAARGTSLPYNFVRAVEVKAGGYEAQYGRALGAVVNAVTYSGTNALEAQVFGFVAHGALAATPRALPALRETGHAAYDVGARVSGPVVRSRLWFTAAYNPRVERVDKELTGLGTYADRTIAHIFASKLTWSATPRTTLELSVFGDPTTRQAVAPLSWAPSLSAVNADPFLRRLEWGGVTGSLRAIASLRHDLLIEAGIAYTRGAGSNLPQTQTGRTQAIYQDFLAGTVEGGAGFISDASEARASGLLRATLLTGRHTVVGGLEYEDTRLSQTNAQSGGVSITRNDSTFWAAITESTTGAFHNRVPTAYLQDAWRLTDRISVSAGVRWSSQSLTGASGTVAQRFPFEWQPRLGFSWLLGRGAAQRLFGSYGRYYQQIPLNLSALNFADYVFIAANYSTDPRQAGATPDSVFDFSTYESDLAHQVNGIEVENFDEVTLAYERLLAGTIRLTLRGVRRHLRSSYQFGFDPSRAQPWVLGTPGKGDFAFLPPPVRDYTALEISLAGSRGGVDFLASYVLSRTWGNYTGLYGSDVDADLPGGSWGFFTPWQAANSTGPLPNDRTHVFKLTTALRVAPPLTLGALLTVATGIPKNDWGVAPLGPVFLAPRGSAGRTPVLWDAALRLACDLFRHRTARGRVLLDVLHVGNPREALQVDEQHFFAVDGAGQPTNPNSNYLQPTAFQPPMAARLGLEFVF